MSLQNDQKKNKVPIKQDENCSRLKNLNISKLNFSALITCDAIAFFQHQQMYNAPSKNN